MRALAFVLLFGLSACTGSIGGMAGEGGGAAGGGGTAGGAGGGSAGGGAATGGGGATGGGAGGGSATGGGAGGGSATGGGTGGGGAVDAGTPLMPGDPGASDVQLEVHADQNHRAISPLIYGSNVGDDMANSHFSALRSGGNRLTAFNWENNASNAGSDYMFENDGYLEASNTPGKAVSDMLDVTGPNQATAVVTVPIVDYVAADKSPGGDVRNSGSNYLTTRFKQNRATKGSALSLTPDTTDAWVNQDEFVSWVTTTYPNQPIIFEMDNEPDLWSSTHAEVHPNPVGYDELCTRNATFAAMVKTIAPNSLVSGPASYGWQGYVNLQGAPDANGKGEFLDYYLAQMKTASDTAGHRLVDFLDLHWYPEAQGGGQRITGTATDAASVAARVQAPRSLWDPSYTETSWITQALGNKPIDLLHRVQTKIDANFPGTKVAFTEWYYGAGQHISGAVATADVLGIFGREGVGMATLWPLTGNESYTWAAFRAFRNYDGAGGAFGDTSVLATTSDTVTATVYGSLRASDPKQMVIVAINKATTQKTAGLKVFAATAYPKLKVYTVTSAGPMPMAQADVSAVATNAFSYPMPPLSISVLVPQP